MINLSNSMCFVKTAKVVADCLRGFEFAGSFVQPREYHRVNEERRSQCARLSMWRRIFGSVEKVGVARLTGTGRRQNPPAS